LIYIFIALFFFTAIIISIIALAKIEIEQAYAERIIDKCEEIKNTSPTSKFEGDLDNVEHILLNNVKYDSAMERMFKYIHSEAKDRRFHPISSTTEIYRQECDNYVFKVINNQRNVLQLGILGTFIGLVLSFSEFSNTNMDDNVIKDIIGSLKYSFSTSIVGLVAAIFIGVMFSLVNKEKEQYFKAMEKSASIFTSIVYSAKNTATDYKRFKDITNAINTNTEVLYEQQKDIKGLTDAINIGLQSLELKSNEFDAFLKNISKAELDYINKMQNIYNVLSPEMISKELNEKLREATFKYFEETNAKYTELNMTILKTNETFNLLSNRINSMASYVDSSVKIQKEFIEVITEYHPTKQLVQTVKDSTKDISNNLNANIVLINSNLSSHKESLDKFYTESKIYIDVSKKNRTIQLLLTVAILLLIGVIIFYIYNIER